MMRLPSLRRSVPTLGPVIAALVLGGVLGTSGVAEAGGHAHFSGSVRFSSPVRVGGSVRISGPRSGISVRVGRPWRPGWRRPYWGGGHVWVGGYYWYPRPYYFYYYPYSESVPSYYGGSYYPVQPNAAPGVVAAAGPRRQPLPVFGLGVSGGGTQIDNGNGKTDATNLSALARLRLTDGLLIEGELGRTSFKDDVRVDRRIGGFLVWELGARNALAPFLLAGGGVQQANVDGDFKTRQEFGEIGVGLRLALSRNLHLALDIRAGRAKTIDSNNDNNRGDIVPLVRVAAPGLSPSNTEDFTRGRLAAILYF